MRRPPGQRFGHERRARSRPDSKVIRTVPDHGGSLQQALERHATTSPFVSGTGSTPRGGASRSAADNQAFPPVGTRVRVRHDGSVSLGILRYVGKLRGVGKPGIFGGIELDSPRGKNDGSVAGERYFSCAPLHGLFCRAHIIEEAKEVPPAAAAPSGDQHVADLRRSSDSAIIAGARNTGLAHLYDERGESDGEGRRTRAAARPRDEQEKERQLAREQEAACKVLAEAVRAAREENERRMREEEFVNRVSGEASTPMERELEQQAAIADEEIARLIRCTNELRGEIHELRVKSEAEQAVQKTLSDASRAQFALQLQQRNREAGEASAELRARSTELIVQSGQLQRTSLELQECRSELVELRHAQARPNNAVISGGSDDDDELERLLAAQLMHLRNELSNVETEVRLAADADDEAGRRNSDMAALDSLASALDDWRRLECRESEIARSLSQELARASFQQATSTSEQQHLHGQLEHSQHELREERLFAEHWRCQASEIVARSSEEQRLLSARFVEQEQEMWQLRSGFANARAQRDARVQAQSQELRCLEEDLSSRQEEVREAQVWRRAECQLSKTVKQHATEIGELLEARSFLIHQRDQTAGANAAIEQELHRLRAETVAQQQRIESLEQCRAVNADVNVVRSGWHSPTGSPHLGIPPDDGSTTESTWNKESVWSPHPTGASSTASTRHGHPNTFVLGLPATTNTNDQMWQRKQITSQQELQCLLRSEQHMTKQATVQQERVQRCHEEEQKLARQLEIRDSELASRRQRSPRRGSVAHEHVEMAAAALAGGAESLAEQLQARARNASELREFQLRERLMRAEATAQQQEIKMLQQWHEDMYALIAEVGARDTEIECLKRALVGAKREQPHPDSQTDNLWRKVVAERDSEIDCLRRQEWQLEEKRWQQPIEVLQLEAQIAEKDAQLEELRSCARMERMRSDVRHATELRMEARCVGGTAVHHKVGSVSDGDVGALPPGPTSPRMRRIESFIDVDSNKAKDPKVWRDWAPDASPHHHLGSSAVPCRSAAAGANSNTDAVKAAAETLVVEALFTTPQRGLRAYNRLEELPEDLDVTF